MSGYENFAVVGAGVTGNFIVRQLLKDKAARVISVDYLNKQPIKDARWGGYRCLYHLICSSWRARSIAEAAKEANVRLFIPSEFGVSSEESLTSFDAKTSVRSHLRALVSGPSYVPFYTADWVWKSCASCHLYLAHSANSRAGSWTSTSQAEKCLSVATATSIFRLLPGLT